MESNKNLSLLRTKLQKGSGKLSGILGYVMRGVSEMICLRLLCPNLPNVFFGVGVVGFGMDVAPPLSL